MKNFVFATLLVIFCWNIQAQEFKTPLEYLNFLGKQEDNITKETWKYTKSIAHSKSGRKIDATRKNLIKSIQLAKNNISNIKNGYQGDTEYRDITLTYLNVSESIISEDYSKIIDLQEVSEQSYDFMEAYIKMQELVNERMDTEHEKVIAGQKKFATKYNITLLEKETEIAKKMKISNAVFDYHSAIYLIFFKSNITDLQLSKAILEKDLAAMQQTAGSLASYSEEGMGKLKQIASFQNDASLLNATQKSLEFYKKATVEQIPAIVDFYMFNTKFEVAKQNIDKKKPADRTKEEIDNFNAMVKEVNQKINNFNKLNAKFDQEKNQIINNWNATVSQFLAKHIPND